MNNEPVLWMDHEGNFWHEKVGYYTIPLYTHPVKEQDGCGNCHACLVGVMENGLPVTFQRMILCPDCGNKRCPKASNHRHQCTESNEPNQLGSIYTHPVKELTISNNEIHKEFLKLIENCDSKLSIGDVGFPALIEDFARAILRKAQEK